MPNRKKIKAADSENNNFAEQVKKLSEGLYYISETDAEVKPFIGGKAAAVSKEEILRLTGSEPDAPVEERNFAEIFARLTRIQDWFGDEEKEIAAKFVRLKDFLEQNLEDLKVFKIGSIQIKVYFVGLDAEGSLTGIQTEAVET
ncbi:MAG: nuclease A inhibitor family protein [Pyrinomonadaceae bacterium]